MEDVKIPLPARPAKFLDKFRAFIRLDGKSYATENTYVYWARQFILFHDKKHPHEMDGKHVVEYLSDLSLRCNASANTQKTALNALMFLYNYFLKKPIEKLDFHYARKPKRTPTVFTHTEALTVIEKLDMPYKLMAQLMYGSGLRVSEVLRLRVKDVDFGMGYLIIRDGKGAKDRTTLLPKSLITDLQNQIFIVSKLLELDIARGVDAVYLPHLLERKYPSAGHSLEWQFIFPSSELSRDPRANAIRRHHLYSSTLQSHVKRAIKASRIYKQASCHTFRHAFATRLLQAKYDLKQIQTLMGHTDIRTTEIYLHVLDDLG
ncbi:MAG: integron integrase, partial [Chitinophagaceae bacterium]